MEPHAGDGGGAVTPTKIALKCSTNLRLRRRGVPMLTLAVLAPFRTAWTPTAGGFEVQLAGQSADGLPWSQTVQLASRVCPFGGWRFYLCCPWCGQRALSLFWDRDCFVCRRCANLQYVSQTVRDPIRLMHHYGRLTESLACPGRRPRRFYVASALAWRACGAWAKQVGAWVDRRASRAGEASGRAGGTHSGR